MSELSQTPPFETIYLEIQPRPNGDTVLLDEVLELFRERSLAGVAAPGSQFGVNTPVIAKLAMTMIDDSALVYSVMPDGTLIPGDFAGDVCEWLARSLDTHVIADEYVLYAPHKEDGAVDFVELDPRRQSIEQPAGFPNEWRLSPEALSTRAVAFTDAQDDFTAAAIAADTNSSITSAPLAGGRVVALPQGVVELPVDPSNDHTKRVILFAQGGDAKYVHMVTGKPKKQLRMTIANMPRFTSAIDSPEGTEARALSDLISHAGLVAGAIQFDHPSFPTPILPLYQELTQPENTHAFFSRVAEILQVPAEVSALADNGFALPQLDLTEHPPTTLPPKKRGWFRR